MSMQNVTIREHDSDFGIDVVQSRKLVLYSLSGFVFGIVSWIYIIASNAEEFWSWYFHFVPNRYRIVQQILLAISGTTLSLGFLHAITWGFSITIFLSILQPDRKESVAILILLSMITIQSLVLSAPGYIILAIYGKNHYHKYSILLLPFLLLIKEYLFYVALIFSLLYSKESSWHKVDYRLLTSIGLSLMAYLSFVLFMGVATSPAEGVPIFTPSFVFSIFQTTPSSHLIIITFFNALAFLFVLDRWSDLASLFILVLPIFLFGFFWESQLWLPALIVLIILKRETKIHESYNYDCMNQYE